MVVRILLEIMAVTAPERIFQIARASPARAPRECDSSVVRAALQSRLGGRRRRLTCANHPVDSVA